MIWVAVALITVLVYQQWQHAKERDKLINALLAASNTPALSAKLSADDPRPLGTVAYMDDEAMAAHQGRDR